MLILFREEVITRELEQSGAIVSSKRTYLNRTKALSLLLVATATVGYGCTKSTDTAGVNSPKNALLQVVTRTAEPIPEARLIRSDYAANEITKLCDAAIAKISQRLDAIAALKPEQRTLDNTLLAYENASADFSDETGNLTFMNYVSTNDALRAEGSACEEKIGQFSVGILTRRDLYNALKDQKPRNPEEARLLSETLEGYEQNGMKLSDEKLAEFKKLKGELASKETQFSTNLNNDATQVAFTAEELVGAQPDFLARLQKNAEGKYIVTGKSTDYVSVMENVTNAETRRRMLEAYLNRGGEANVKLLEEAVALRSKIAKVMGYETWADYRTVTRMAKDKKTVTEFLSSLRGKLAERNAQDMAKLLAFKKELEPSATTLNQWDLAYLSAQLQKRDYNLDTEKIREYFPSDVVVNGMFAVYSRMLGVKYVEVTNAKVWADGVKLYEIREASNDQVIAYFYADYFPRQGKYGHAAAFPLIAGRRMADGKYSIPVASIVANFTPPTGDKPSLMTHDEVETTFHEFGHIMHQVLTRAPYASLAGTSVAQDFVEAPSQMLENWVWSPVVLPMISGHYKDKSQKLPQDLLEKMIAAQDFMQGYSYTKQLLYGSFDMSIHTQGEKVDTTKTYDQLYREIIGQEPIAGGKFAAGFGHMMGGYDAGYYGYLWSKVYAEDMFSIFPKEDIMSPEVGGRYRKLILEQGNMRESIDLLREFLGREPNSDAFFKKIGI